MSYESKVFDLNKNPIEVGTRVRYFDSADEGTVTEISEWDFDVEGAIEPFVYVLFDGKDGPERFRTAAVTSPAWYSDDDPPDVECEELDVVSKENIVQGES